MHKAVAGTGLLISRLLSDRLLCLVQSSSIFGRVIPDYRNVAYPHLWLNSLTVVYAVTIACHEGLASVFHSCPYLLDDANRSLYRYCRALTRT